MSSDHTCVVIADLEIRFIGPYRRRVRCACGWEVDRAMERNEAVQRFAEHYATEMQAKKPRARRGGVDESEPTSKSHTAVIETMQKHRMEGDNWHKAVMIHDLQERHFGYSPQRVRTCLAGLVRAGIVEERKVGKYREYRLAKIREDNDDA